IGIVASDLDQDWNAVVFWQLTEGEHGFAFHLSFRIVVDGTANGAHGLLAGALREPEQRLASHIRTAIVSGERDDGVDRFVAWMPDQRAQRRVDDLGRTLTSGLGRLDLRSQPGSALRRCNA